MAYGALVFVVSLMIRVHHLTIANAGTTYAALLTVGAILGSVGGGALPDRLAARDIARLAQVAGWALIGAWPVYELAFSAPSLLALVLFLLGATILLTAALPALFAALHVVGGSRRRALAVAAALFLSNLIGIGLGPVMTGP
jgi:hypothetical protein